MVASAVPSSSSNSPDPSAPHPTEAAAAVHAGLTAAEAALRLQRDGPNVLPKPPSPSAWRVLAQQLFHFFALMLWGAAGLALLAGMPQLTVAIVVIVVVNGLFAFAQEHRAERAAEHLRDLLPRSATVIRDGRPGAVDAGDLVVDDLVVLEAGDRISADLEAVEAHALTVDTSTLTGESVPVNVGEGQPLLAGTFVVEGEATAVVTATGGRTRLAGIAHLTRAGQRPPSPLARELHGVVRTVAAMAIGVGVLFFLVALWLGLPAGSGFLFAIGVTVALVPEGLLPTVTLSLAVGAQRMARRNALVRRLESVETLGSTTFICTDKTGTLTQNEMAVVEVWLPHGTATIEGRGYEPTGLVTVAPQARAPLADAALAAVRCSSGRIVQDPRDPDGRWQAHGDPMEAALDALARRLGIDADADARAHPADRRFPFDPRRRRMSILVGDRLLVKGAPDAVLPRCAHVDGTAAELDALAHRGLRVLAIAARRLSADERQQALAGQLDAEALERRLVLLALVGLQDPPRPGAAAAIAACRQQGIKIAMITGDHPGTARAIAAQVGLLLDGARVLEGRDLPTDEAALGALLDRDGVVVSRVAPEEKLRIAKALRARGHVVAMTGDGVNDGPALQAADIGVAMGKRGTDVAREASDLVLLDDDFATIVAAVTQGRATFANIRRFLTYHLTDNVAELTPFVVWAVAGGLFPLALGVLQVLCLDVLTDQIPALALGIEPPGADVPKEPPRQQRLLDGAMLFRVFGVLGPVEALMEMAAFSAVLWAAGWRPGGELPDALTILSASGAAFAAVVIGQAANVFACRDTRRWPGRLGWTSNRLILVGVGVELALLGLLLYVSPLAALLGQAPPTLLGWGIALLTAPAVLLADLAHKRVLAKVAA
ncbi:MAG: cation-transporting P-type ATPase [Chloroflexi bacterium]|nr:cation-transporting P-type ATPase [Chloroflexota bacterium]